MHRGDFCTLLFEMLSFPLSDNELDAILAALRTIFQRASPEDISAALDVGLDNLLALSRTMAAAGAERVCMCLVKHAYEEATHKPTIARYTNGTSMCKIIEGRETVFNRFKITLLPENR